MTRPDFESMVAALWAMWFAVIFWFADIAPAFWTCAVIAMFLVASIGRGE